MTRPRARGDDRDASGRPVILLGLAVGLVAAGVITLLVLTFGPLVWVIAVSALVAAAGSIGVLVLGDRVFDVGIDGVKLSLRIYGAIVVLTVLGLWANHRGALAVQEAPVFEPSWSAPAGAAEDRGYFSIEVVDLSGDDEHVEILASQPMWADRSGRVLVFRGTDRSAPVSEITSPRAGPSGYLFGVSLSGGDVDGDGVVELAVGERSPAEPEGGSSSGQVAIYELMHPLGVDLQPALSLENPLGALASAADRFGDHVRTLEEGAELRGLRVGDRAVAYLVGAPDSRTPSRASHDHGAIHAFDSGGQHLWSSYGNPGEHLGKWLDVGDVDGDGAVDLVVGGARSLEPGSPSPASGGVVRVWSTPESGDLGAARSYELSKPARSPSQSFGYRVHLGDPTGDGRTDLLVADPRADGWQGAVYLYAGPLGPNVQPAWILRGDSTLTRPRPPLLGRGIDLGDVNGDGVDDFVVGMPARAVRETFARIYLYLGAPVEELPGSGRQPRVAISPQSDAQFSVPTGGVFGEQSKLAQIWGDQTPELVATILNGPAESLGLHVFQIRGTPLLPSN